MQEGKRRILNDIILVLVLLVVGLSVFLVISLSRDDGEAVLVKVGDEEVLRVSLSEDGEYSVNGGSNILVIEDGNAYVKHATCPDGLCKRQGKISRAGERILCLPNRVIIEVLGDGGFIER